MAVDACNQYDIQHSKHKKQEAGKVFKNSVQVLKYIAVKHTAQSVNITGEKRRPEPQSARQPVNS